MGVLACRPPAEWSRQHQMLGLPAQLPHSNRVSGDEGRRCQERVCRPEKEAPKRRGPHVSQRRSGWNKTPPIRGLINHHRKSPVRRSAWWWTRSDANPSPHPDSRTTGKNTGNFATSGFSSAVFVSDRRVNAMACSGIPCAWEQGISRRVSGKACQRNRKFKHQNRVFDRDRMISHRLGAMDFILILQRMKQTANPQQVIDRLAVGTGQPTPSRMLREPPRRRGSACSACAPPRSGLLNSARWSGPGSQ